MADSFFALEIGESFTKLMDAKKTGNIIEATALDYLESDNGFYTTDLEKHIENQTAIINKLTTASKITKKNVTIIIPDSFTYTQILSLPFLNEKELLSAIKYQADQFIPIPLEEANVDIEILKEEEAEKKIKMLLVAAPKKLIEKIQETVESAGLIPEAVENETSSNARFMAEMGNLLQFQKEKKILTINLGANSTSFYLFDLQSSQLTANRPLLLETHNFKLGYQLFLKEIQINTNFDIKKSQEILKTYDQKNKTSFDIKPIITPVLKEFFSEIKRFLGLINEKYHSQTLPEIYFINEVFQFPAICSFAEEFFALPVKALNPSIIFKNSPLVESHKNQLSLFISTIGANLR